MKNTLLKFLDHWRAKAGSFLVAVLVFSYVNYTKNVTRVIQIRLEKPDLPANLVLSDNLPSFVNVQFSGPREQMDFPVSDFRILLTNPRPAIGENIYRARLLPDLPDRIKAKYNSNVTVTLDIVMTRDLAVDPDIDYALESGFQAGYVWTIPRTVSVRGPSRIVSDMDRIRTQKFTIRSRENFFSKKVLIADLPEFTQLAPNQPIEVEVSARILSADIGGDTSTPLTMVKIPVRCINEIRGLVLKIPGSTFVEALVNAEKNIVAPDQFTARVYCPVFFDENTKTIKPSFLVESIPIFVDDRFSRNNVQILKIEPTRVTLQFERVEVVRPNEIQEGLEEHRIPR